MKILIVFLFAQALCATAPCDEKDYYDGTDCIACDKSPCKTCAGTGVCADCPEGIQLLISGKCNICEKDGYIIVNKKCVACDDASIGGVGAYNRCTCTDNNDCCTNDGLYRNGNDCYSCSVAILGCTKCKYEDSAAKCSECDSDFKLDDGKCVWDSATHLFAVGGLLISLLILA